MATARILLVGASVRAAAFSALRAGLEPLCFDLFADADLQARSRAVRIRADQYPGAFLHLAQSAPPGPWMYTGALENHPRLVQALVDERTLWGSDSAVLRRARSPQFLFDLLHASRIPCPRIRLNPVAESSPARWLLKPFRSAGGSNIRAWSGDAEVCRPQRGFYLQEHIVGEPAAALYLGNGEASRLLGVTRQLVGEPWLHAAAFRYCGSIGPCKVEQGLHGALERLGRVLVQGCGLRGLFGVDFIFREGIAWPIEVNPRYTASVEILEYAGIPAFALHRGVFEAAPVPGNAIKPGMVGKAILYARGDLVFPQHGPWVATLTDPGPTGVMPAFADIPHAGEHIAAGQPILTFFGSAASEPKCLSALRHIAHDLDRWLFPR